MEKKISELEAEEKDLQASIADPANATNADLLTELCTKLDEVRNDLSGFIDEYLEEYSED